MNNWKQQKMGNVADIKLSNVDKLTNENERIVRLCNYTDVYKNSFINIEKSQSFMIASCNESEYEKFILRKGQVAITKDSETPNDIGISTYILDDFKDVVLGYHLALITPDINKLNGQFLHYWLNTKQAKRYFENNAGGSGQRCTLVLDCIKSTPLYLPSLSTQEKIAKVLSDLDAKIELNNRINRELETMAKTLYDYWFVQFDFPNDQGKPYKSSGGKMVYNAELKRDIPVGWQNGCIGDYCSSTGGFAFKSSWWSDIGVSVVKIKDIQEDYTIDISELAKVELADKKVDDKFKAKPGDILIAMTGATVGKYGIVPITDYPIYVNQRVGYFNLGKEPTEKLPYLINSLNQSYVREMIFSLASGAAQPNISNEQINKITLVIPDRTIVNNYNLKFSPFYKTILNNQRQNQQLTELRGWLLPMLMNGQVKVKEAEEKGTEKEKPIINLFKPQDQRFELWLTNQGIAARGNIDKKTLRDIFDAMDDDDK